MQDEEVLGKAYDARLMRRLITYLRPYKKYVGWAFVLIILDAGLETAFPLLTKIAIDKYIGAANYRGLAMVAIAYVVFLILKFVAESLQSYTLSITGQHIMYDMRMQVFRHLHTLSASFFD